MALTQVTSAGVKDGELVNADLHSAAAIALSKLGTSGTAGSGNFLRGDGAWTAISLDALNASNLTSGTVPDARFPATLPAASGVNLTALNGSNISSGTIAAARVATLNQNTTGTSGGFTAGSASNLNAGTLPDARFPATLPAASGVNLTALNASNLSSGTVATVRLGSGTASSSTYLRGDNTWAAVSTSDNTKLPLAGGSMTGNLTLNDNYKVRFGNDGDATCEYNSGSDRINIYLSKDVLIDYAVSNSAGTVKMNRDVKFGDHSSSYNKRCIFGNSDDLVIYHNGSHSRIDNNGTGNLYINAADGETGISIIKNGSIDLYYDNSKKAETVSGGFTVSGTCTATAFSGDGSSLTNVSASDSTKLPLSGGTLTGNVEFGYSKKLGFAGDNLTIWHDGGNAYIENDGGDLFLHGTNNAIHIRPVNSEDSIKAIEHGAVELYYDDTKMLETYNDGIKLKSAGGVGNCRYIRDDTVIYLGNMNGTKTYLKATANTSVELNHNNSKKFETTSGGAAVTGTLSGAFKCANNASLTLGTSNPGTILHTGNDLQINNATGPLYLRSNGGFLVTGSTSGGEAQIGAAVNGSADLYYDGSKKLETTSSGVSITGDLSVSGSVGGAGKVLQVIQTLKSDTASYTGWTETDISGMTCSITPSSSSNKILVIVSACLASTGSAAITLYRGSTKIGCGDTATNRTPVLFGGYAGGGSYGPMYFGAWVHSHTILDSPSTTSATTYKLRWLAESGGNTKYLNRSVYDMSNNVNHQERTCSTITLMEISA